MKLSRVVKHQKSQLSMTAWKTIASDAFCAVERFSADQIMALAKQGGASPAEAQAMFDTYVARVLVVGAIAGVLLGALAAWWLLRRILRPLDRLA